MGIPSAPAASIALSARVDWNNITQLQEIDNSGPTTDLKGWFVTGWNGGRNEYMIVDVQCVAASDIPGAFLVQSSWQNTSSTYATDVLWAGCPDGMTLLNGGSYILGADGSVDTTSYLGTAYRTFPSGNGWAVTADVESQDTLYDSAWCVPNQPPTLSSSADRRPTRRAPPRGSGSPLRIRRAQVVTR